MKYKEVFKAWWFYLIVLLYSVYSIIINLNEYGKLFFVEYIGIFLGSFLGALVFYSVIWCLCVFFNNIIKKFTKR